MELVEGFMDEELNEFDNSYPTLSEMDKAYRELYRHTLSYQAWELEQSLAELGKEIRSFFLVPLFGVFEFVASTLYRYIGPIIEWLDANEDEPEYVDVLVRHDGEILVIEDAPPIEILSKRKNG